MNFISIRGIASLIYRKASFDLNHVCINRQISQSVNRLQFDREIEEKGNKPMKQERQEVDPDTSIKYLDSKAFTDCYGKDPIWKHYRRNFKGGFPPRTRKKCVRGGAYGTNNPCPICRDEYLVVDYRNLKLLQHFINPVTGVVIPTERTGVCQTQQQKLLLEVYKAKEYGYFEDRVPLREYNYEEYEPEKVDFFASFTNK